MLERLLRIYWASCPWLEPSTYRKLFMHFGSVKDMHHATVEQWLAAARLRPETVSRMETWRHQALQRLERIEDHLGQNGIVCVVQGDSLYPKQLFDLYDPPVVLFALGNAELLCQCSTAISIVGTRRASGYGLEVTKWLSSRLASRGVMTVSGMALGIDACAGETGLLSGVPSVAILGCGVDVCYPPSNRKLYDLLKQEGLLLSEYPIKSLAAKHRFPERNRLIAALSMATVVVQAGEKSGSLRTVQSALEIGRDVYVVPGPITSKSFRGSHQLLLEGAIPLIDPESFAKDLFGASGDMDGSGRELDRRIPAHLRTIADVLLEEGPLRAGELAEAVGDAPGHMYAALLELELSGLVTRLSDGRYQISGLVSR
jgi:DNA processing protein